MSAFMQRESPSRELAVITPELAERWLLERNAVNCRRPSWHIVRQYAQQMREGAWPDAHPDAIQFDWFGYIGNGQHRLNAVKESGVTIRMWVERGIDPALFAFTDKGRVRTNGDDLSRRGFRKDVSHSRAAAVAKAMLRGLRADFSVQGVGEFAMLHENLIGSILLELNRAKPNRAEVAAAFCKAAFVFPESSVLASAARYAAKKFTGGPDPLSKLHDRVVSFAVSGGRPWDLYSYAVAAVRADLEGREISKLNQAEKDFAMPGDPDYVPVEQRERGRKGWQTRQQRAASNGGSHPTDESELFVAQERKGPPPGPPTAGPRFQRGY